MTEDQGARDEMREAFDRSFERRHEVTLDHLRGDFSTGQIYRKEYNIWQEAIAAYQNSQPAAGEVPAMTEDIMEEIRLGFGRAIETLKAAGPNNAVILQPELFERWIPLWEAALECIPTPTG